MAVEIQTEHPLYRTNNPQAVASRPDDFEERQRSRSQRQLKHDTNRDRLALAMRHHFLHDLESMFWIALWFICTTIPPTLQLTTEELRTQYNGLGSLFPRSLDGASYRAKFVAYDEQDYFTALTFIPKQCLDVAIRLYDALETLFLQYGIWEVQQPEGYFGKSFVSVYNNVAACVVFASKAGLEVVSPLPANPILLENQDDGDADSSENETSPLESPAPRPCASRDSKKRAPPEESAGDYPGSQPPSNQKRKLEGGLSRPTTRASSKRDQAREEVVE